MVRFRDLTAVSVGLAVLGLACACQVSSPPEGGATSAAAAATAVPAGTIVAFAGSVVPAGWALCDGRTTSTGRITPDLRNRFVLGLDPATGAVGEVGGSADHVHTASVSESRGDRKDVEDGDDHDVADDDHSHTVTVGRASNLPPFVKLAYIMKE